MCIHRQSIGYLRTSTTGCIHRRWWLSARWQWTACTEFSQHESHGFSKLLMKSCRVSIVCVMLCDASVLVCVTLCDAIGPICHPRSPISGIRELPLPNKSHQSPRILFGGYSNQALIWETQNQCPFSKSERSLIQFLYFFG